MLRGSKRGSPTQGSDSTKKKSRRGVHVDKENSLNSASIDDEQHSSPEDDASEDAAEAMYDDAGEDNDDDEAMEDEELEDVEEELDDDEAPEEEDDDVPPTLQHAKGTQPRTSTGAGQKSPEAGIITKVYCENFMCHKKLTVDLCPNVNFINGQNGSGTSIGPAMTLESSTVGFVPHSLRLLSHRQKCYSRCDQDLFRFQCQTDWPSR